LYNRPDKQDEENVIEDEENRCGAIFPRPHVSHQQLDYAEVDEQHDDGNDDKKEVWIFFSEFLKHARLLIYYFR